MLGARRRVVRRRRPARRAARARDAGGVRPYLPQAPLEGASAPVGRALEYTTTPCVVVLDHVHPVFARMPMEVGGMRLPVVRRASRMAPASQACIRRCECCPKTIYAQFSEQHRMFEAAFRATTGAYFYAVVRLALGLKDDE